MISAYIIDDHQMIIEGIQSILNDETDIKWLGSIKKPEGSIAFLKNEPPDVLLMYINLPEKSGPDLCREQ
jgi:DNA-binding NarL/FixJ family response regulator